MAQLKIQEDRRVLPDRRKFTYTAYCPERRSGLDRRIESQKPKVKVA